MSTPDRPSIERERPTAIGCAVMLLTLFVIFGTALPIVHWRDPETGRPLPRLIAIFTPLLIGAAFHAALDGMLRLIGSLTRRNATRSEPTPEQTVDDLLKALDEERKKQSTEFFEKRDSRKE